jgi:hypothetical protein
MNVTSNLHTARIVYLEWGAGFHRWETQGETQGQTGNPGTGNPGTDGTFSRIV